MSEIDRNERGVWRHPPVDPLSAIRARDPAALSASVGPKASEAYMTYMTIPVALGHLLAIALDRLSVESEGTSDDLPPPQVINFRILSAYCIEMNWPQGLQILSERMPAEVLTERNWLFALTAEVPEALEWLWNAMRSDLNIADHAQVESWAAVLLKALPSPISAAQPDLRPAIRFLLKHGVHLEDYAAPGSFMPNDVRTNGQSLFTRALFLGHWGTADLLWPPKLPSTLAWPRRDEQLVHLVAVSVSDWQTLIEADRQCAMQVVQRWLAQFGPEWISQTPGLIARLAAPTRTRIGPWLRLPLAFADADRTALWATWKAAADIDPIWLHELATYPDDPQVQQVMRLAAHDSAEVFIRYWNAQGPGDPEQGEGFSPQQRWLAMGGDPDLTAWCAR